METGEFDFSNPEILTASGDIISVGEDNVTTILILDARIRELNAQAREGSIETSQAESQIVSLESQRRVLEWGLKKEQLAKLEQLRSPGGGI